MFEFMNYLFDYPGRLETWNQLPCHKRMFSMVAKQLKKSHTVFDAGCGTCRLARVLRGKKVYSYDRLKILNRVTVRGVPTNCKLIAGDLNKRLRAYPNSMDAIASILVLYSLNDPVSTLGEFHRVLKPGGKLVIVNPTRRYSLKEKLSADQPSISPKDFKKIRVAIDAQELEMRFFWIKNILLAMFGLGKKFHAYSPYDMRRMLMKAGFQDIEITPICHNLDIFVTATK